MILGRVVAGAGAGGLNAIGTFVGSDLIPLGARGMWQGFGNIVYTASTVLRGVVRRQHKPLLGLAVGIHDVDPFTLLCALRL